jgi:hypothetical protein
MIQIYKILNELLALLLMSFLMYESKLSSALTHFFSLVRLFYFSDWLLSSVASFLDFLSLLIAVSLDLGSAKEFLLCITLMVLL